jgi:hypothetical protein
MKLVPLAFLGAQNIRPVFFNQPDNYVFSALPGIVPVPVIFKTQIKCHYTQIYIFFHNVDALVKSLISDGAVKSSRSRLAQFRRMQRT